MFAKIALGFRQLTS